MSKMQFAIDKIRKKCKYILEEWDNSLVEMLHRAERLQVYSSFPAQNTNPFFPF